MSGTMYHYCPTDALLKILESKTIWLSDFKTTNDKMEGRWADDLLSLPNDLPHREDILSALSLERHLAYRGPTYVACFSLEGDLLSQWRGYANDGQGVAIGFRADLVAKRPPFEIGLSYSDYELTAVDVVYDKGEQRRYLQQLLSWYVEECQGKSGSEPEGMVPALLVFLDHLRASMKNPGFSEERERRIIFKPQGFKYDGRRSFKGTKNLMEAHVRAAVDRIIEYFDYPLPEDAVREVVLGPKNESTEETINLVLSSNGFSNARVSRSKASYR